MKSSNTTNNFLTHPEKAYQTIPLHTDRIKSVGESERLLAAGEWGVILTLFNRVEFASDRT
jgi:hypothetical protein